eukprot:2440610-Pleurochrysis_carterae.AAC.6
MLGTLRAPLPTYPSMSPARPCLGAIETHGEMERRLYDVSIVDGLSAWTFALQNSGDVTPSDFHLTLA